MNENELALLANIYRNAEMGRDGLYFVLQRTGDTAFRRVVATQLTEYQAIMDEAEDRLRVAGYSPTGNGPIAKMMVHMTACHKTAQDNSPSALADMLIQGSSMGVTKIARQISHSRAPGEDVLALAERLQKTEENNIAHMKAYL